MLYFFSALLVLTRILFISLSYVARFDPLHKGLNASSILLKSISSIFYELITLENFLTESAIY